MTKTCKWCGSSEHTQFNCYKKPRKPIKKIGKKAVKWQDTSKLWKQVNPPDEYGFWYCKVGGGRLSDKPDAEAFRLNLCHDKSRARHPELAFTLSNIFPGCQLHNKEQGSQSLEEYLNGPHSFSCGDF